MSSKMYEIGRIGRPRGLDGWLRFDPSDTRSAHFITETPVVYIKNSRSGFQPLRILDFYTEQKRNDTTFFVKFDMITTRSEAEAVKDKTLYSDHFEPGEDSALPGGDEPDITGYKVFREGVSETAGYVLDLVENPAHSILEIKIGNGSLLIPFVDEYIADVDHQNRRILCRNLHQLMDED